jgi:uncharacterized protein YndB with AHSA1/START domain
MATTSTISSVHVNAPRPKVYQALIDAQAVAQWDVPHGMTIQIHEFDGCEGGNFRITLTYEETTSKGKTLSQTDTYHGYFSKLVPNEKVIETIEFETSDEKMRGEMTVTFTLTDAEGGTDVLAKHENLPPGLSPADNEIGWRMSLDNLAALFETG